MNKKTYSSINLSCTRQQDNEITSEKCLVGIISKTSNGFLFEESVRKDRPPRNPKLFDGNYCSLVHMPNGKYQIHMKTINASAISDPNDFAFKVYSELLSAFKVIE